ncbi:hypothetical protein SAMN05421852_12529 [Thermoflavimicrobium dichotomicum]|uniref:Uncharacterized protein n=2 Tax=Thermoflavimicrobium dichotomicum TaxID=46223 RepID=A0A1I3UIP9_9BACL|nr:hypothetical protein SAMN05421852_12529 [Thermoflavimicrobium dichotomicum]
MNEFEMSLFENALDSIDHGLEHFDQYQLTNRLRDAKQCVINLISGIDLLILQAVEKNLGEDEIYKKKKNGEPDYNRTIDPIDGLKKLNISKSRYGPDDQEKSSYSDLKRLRNFAIHHSKQKYKMAFFEFDVSYLVLYMVRFTKEFLNSDIRIYLPEHTQELILELIKDKDWFQLVEREEILSNFRFMQYESITDGCQSPVSVEPCLNCHEYMISIDENLFKVGYCINCFTKYQMARCLRCDCLVPSYDMEFCLCDSCQVYFRDYY